MFAGGCPWGWWGSGEWGAAWVLVSVWLLLMEGWGSLPMEGWGSLPMEGWVL